VEKFYSLYYISEILFNSVIMSCLMWCIRKERNRRTFEGIEASLHQLKFLFLRVLYEWRSKSSTFSTFSFLDFLAEFIITR
jgi:hypothetical protein